LLSLAKRYSFRAFDHVSLGGITDSWLLGCPTGRRPVFPSLAAPCSSAVPRVDPNRSWYVRALNSRGNRTNIFLRSPVLNSVPMHMFSCKPIYARHIQEQGGSGYLAFGSNDYELAEKRFVMAAELHRPAKRHFGLQLIDLDCTTVGSNALSLLALKSELSDDNAPNHVLQMHMDNDTFLAVEAKNLQCSTPGAWMMFLDHASSFNAYASEYEISGEDTLPSSRVRAWFCVRCCPLLRRYCQRTRRSPDMPCMTRVYKDK
jgi:hypothetical protein